MAVPVGLTTLLAVLIFAGGGREPVPVISEVFALGLSTYASVCAVLAARSRSGRSRTAWTIMAAALAAWAIGDLIWLFSEYVLRTSPFPSPADVFYLLFPLLAALAMAHFSAERRESRLRILLDGVTVALCLFLLAWILALNDVYQTYRDDRLTLGLALVYPAADVLALSIGVTVLARADIRQRVVLYLLVIGLAFTAVSDSAFAYLVAGDRYTAGNPIDLGWAVALLAIAAAALLSRRSRPLTSPPTLAVPSNSSLWLPYVPLLLAGTVGPAVVMTGLERILVPLIVATVCVRQSVSAWENRRLLAAAANQALRDPLTGLANRTLFNDRLAHAMMLRLRDNRSVAVVSLDLDDFKLVNDSLGHPTADSLLVHAGKRVAECVRPGDTVARVGGDEFSVLLESEVDDSHLIAQRVVEAFNKPFVVEGQNILMRPSVGVAVAPVDEDLAPDTLIKRADIAMYAAKRSRSSRVHTFSAEMMIADPDAIEWAGNGADRTPCEGAAQVRLLGELRRAVDTGGLNVVYQPKYDLRTGLVVGVEALLRWPHPELGMLRPDAFMSLVRQHGLMRPVTDLVLDKVLEDAARWAAHGAQMPVAVNLFAPFLHDTRLPDTLCSALERRGLSAESLTVEITEDLVLTELNLVTAVLQRLRSSGIRVAIDDFGSGYSALSYLRDLPIDEIKLDRHFIASVTNNDRAAAVVRAVIELAHNLDTTVVAEGIEDASTAAWLRDEGCDIGQGYYFGKPIDAAGVPDLITVAADPA